MVTRHMAKMTHEEYLPRCRVPVITSPEEEQRIISTSAKVRSGRGGEGRGEWRVGEYKRPSYIYLACCGKLHLVVMVPLTVSPSLAPGSGKCCWGGVWCIHEMWTLQCG